MSASILTAVAAPGEEPRRPAIPTFFVVEEPALAQIEVSFRRLLQHLSDRITILELDNASLKTSLKERTQHEDDFDQSLSVVQDTVAELETTVKQQQAEITQLQRAANIAIVSPFNGLRPDRSQRRSGLGHK